MKRTPLKRGNRNLARVSKKKKQENKYLDKINERHELFMQEQNELIQKNFDMWRELYVRYLTLPLGDRRCQSCGKGLSSEPRSYYFDHLIEKSKRPDLTLERDNIFLCCLECHALKTDGHPTEVHQKAIEKAKRKVWHELKTT